MKQTSSSFRNSFKPRFRFSKLSLAQTVLIFAVVGGYFFISSYASGLTGDINNDGTVNITDLSLLLSSYGTSTTACLTSAQYTCDLNSDASVNIFDLSILLSHYGQSSGFVQVCGTQLCVGGSQIRIKGATAYGQYSNTNYEIPLAQNGNLNTLEVVEFNSQYHNLSTAMSENTWQPVDNFIYQASLAHMHVILHLADFGQALQAAGYTLSDSSWQTQWNNFLSFIANRTNTVSHIQYKNDPTIAMLEIWGEIPAPDGSGGAPSCHATCWTAAQMQAFYHNTMSQWHTLAPNILTSSGGFSYLDYNSGIPWKAVMDDPSNQVCDTEVNSSGDRNTSIPMVTNECQGLGKPWFLSAWSSCFQTGGGDLTNQQTVAGMVAHAQDMYAVANGLNPPAAYQGIGSDFWNLGPGIGQTCDLNNNPNGYPTVWQVIQQSS